MQTDFAHTTSKRATTTRPDGTSDQSAAPSAPQPHDQPRSADMLAEALTATGVCTAFSLPGGTIAPLNDALLAAGEMHIVTVRHENNGVYMAAGFARLSNGPAFMLATSGPGLLNCVNGLASARCDHLPVILLAGEVARSLHGRHALQDGHSLHVGQVLTAVTKWAAEVPTPSAVLPMFHRAVQVAMSEPRGPVALTLPVDVLAGCVPRTFPPIEFVSHSWPTWSTLKPVVETIGTCSSVAILAGSGVRSGEGARALLELAEALGCPVMTTPKAKGVFPESHPLSLGVFGWCGHPTARQFMERGVDCLLVLGSSLGELATDGIGSPGLRRQTLIHVDCDLAQVGRNYATDIAIGAPVIPFMRALYQVLPARPSERSHLYGCERNKIITTASSRPERLISPVRALREIQAILPDDTIYVVDSGEHTAFAVHYMNIDNHDSFIAMMGLGSMGASVCGVGAKLARPERTVAVICGDGGYSMIATEIGTAVREGLDMYFFILNDRRLGMVEIGNTEIFGRTPDYSTEPLDIAGLARAVGADAAIVEHAGDILALEVACDRRTRPLVVDVRIDRLVKKPDQRRFTTLRTTSYEIRDWMADMPITERLDSLQDFSINDNEEEQP